MISTGDYMPCPLAWLSTLVAFRPPPRLSTLGCADTRDILPDKPFPVPGRKSLTRTWRTRVFSTVGM